jgi:hypothetical protein
MLKYMSLLLAAIPVLAADHPITVSGGTPLMITHEEWVPGGDDQSLGTKYDKASVTYIEVTLGSLALKPIQVGRKPCTISFQYGGMGIDIRTTHGGRMLRIKTDGRLSRDFKQTDKGTLVSAVTDQHVSKLQVTGAASDPGIPAGFVGHVEIKIHYED